MNPAASITCPRCGARPGGPCFTRWGNAAFGLHMARIRALHALRRASDPRQIDLFTPRAGTKQGVLFDDGATT